MCCGFWRTSTGGRTPAGRREPFRVCDYRFVRYYTGSSAYRENGPPKLLARATAPVLVVATVSLFASGVSLMVIGHGSSGVLAVHVVSFVVWTAAIAAHLVVHAPGVLRSLKQDWRTLMRRSVAGSAIRGMLLAAALGGGLALALAVLGLITGWHGD